MLPVRSVASAIVSVVLLVVLGACTVKESKDPVDAVSPRATKPEAAPDTRAPQAPKEEEHALHNVIRVNDKLISGSAPDTAAAFAELKALGVKTIISVDGAAPRVDLARAQGFRYVHLPVGYNGIAPGQQLVLARAVRDLEGPIYLHCHHGKHRGPAAAASAAVVLGSMSAEDGVALLQKAGTAPSYTGLFACVREASPASAATLDAVPAVFPEVAALPDFVKSMAAAQDAYDHLAEIKEAGWSPPATHPDLVPLAEAAQLENLLRGLLADPEVAREPPEFHALLKDANARAKALEDDLAAKATAAQLSNQLKAVNDACKSCHSKYRDTKSLSR